MADLTKPVSDTDRSQSENTADETGLGESETIETNDNRSETGSGDLGKTKGEHDSDIQSQTVLEQNPSPHRGKTSPKKSDKSSPVKVNKKKGSVISKLGIKLKGSHPRELNISENQLSQSMDALVNIKEVSPSKANGNRSSSLANIYSTPPKKIGRRFSVFEFGSKRKKKGKGGYDAESPLFQDHTQNSSSEYRNNVSKNFGGLNRQEGSFDSASESISVVSENVNLSDGSLEATESGGDVTQVSEISKDSKFVIFEYMNQSFDLGQENSLRQRRNELMQHSFFHLDVWLKEGVELVARDSSGTSDPYVKFKVGGKQYYKSRTVYKNLNPKWDEKFMIPIEDVTKPVVVKCFDYDRGMSDDPMGSAEINIASLDLNAATEVKLNLAGEKKDEGYMGYLLVQCTLTPKSAQEKELHQTRSSTLKKPGGSMEGASKKLKQQIWSGVVTIVLVEGTNLMAMDDNGFSDPYVKFRLGQEKYKSKHVSKTLNPRWLEQFDLRIFDDQSKILEITLFDHDISRDDFMGRATMDLSQLGKEMTHEIDKELEDGAGVLKLLLTISGTHSNESVTDLTTYTADPRERDALYKKYGVFNSFKSIKDIGWLQVKVFKAQGLASADIGGKSDPFCVLELCNARLQTQTEYKTLNPEWNKVFTMDIKDVHAILEVTVYDEDRDKKVEFLGKMAIPLLNIKRGERRWYALKDKKLMARAKGAIMLEMDFIYNPVRAAIRTVNPREEKYMQTEQKFKISIMKRNIDRVTKIAESAVEGGKFLNSCFSWESKPRSMTAFLVFIIITLSFELYMLPVSIIIIFIKGYVMKCVQEAFSTESKHDDMMYVDDEDDDDDDDSKDKQEEKKSVREKFQAAQEVCLQVQEGMDMVASMGERVKNTFNWTVPWLSMLAVIGLSIGVVVLYFVPIRYLILAWGINKFTKKLRAPNAIPNNELMDFLSRIPSDSELVKYRELRPDVPNLFKKKRA